MPPVLRAPRVWCLAAVLVTTTAAAAVAAPPGADRGLEARVLRAKRRVMPSVVTVVPVQEFFVGGERQKRLGTGSGVIIDRDGHVVTNQHVIGKGKKVLCILSDEREVPATVVGSDPYTDLAVIKLDADTLGGPAPFARFGDSDKLEQGQFVIALGSPFGLMRTLSMGVVSTTQRVLPLRQNNVGRYNTWVQTDAAINPGNSGGPLVDLRGRVVGINTRGLVGVAENIGFALPSNLVKEISRVLIADGRVSRSTLGLRFQSMESVRWILGTRGGLAPTGALVAAVEPGSPAQAAGALPGDIVMAIDGVPVDGRYDQHIPPLRKRIADMPEGREVVLRVLRRDAELTLSMRTAPLDVFYAEEFQAEAWGLTVTAVTDKIRLAQRLDDTSGVHVASAARGKPGHRGGLRAGDIIYHLDDEPVVDLDSFRELYDAVREDKPLVLLEVRNGSFYRFVLVKTKKKADDTQEDEQPEEGTAAATEGAASAETDEVEAETAPNAAAADEAEPATTDEIEAEPAPNDATDGPTPDAEQQAPSE